MNCHLAHIVRCSSPIALGMNRTRSKAQWSPASRLCHLVALTTAAAFAIPVGELTATTRRAPYVAFARQSAMYLAHVALGLSYSEVGRAFGRDRTTAAYACQLIEDRRDDPAVDAVLGSLESACDVLCGAARWRP